MDNRTVGVVIGVLLTVISLLVGGILYVSYRGSSHVGGSPRKRRGWIGVAAGGSGSGSSGDGGGNTTPTHSLLTRKFTDRWVLFRHFTGKW